jgi:DNA-binding response OmpR family regulator
VLVSNVESNFGTALVRHLGERGWTALYVPSAREALFRWESIRPRCLVTGFDDGDVDGFEFLGAVADRSAVAPYPGPRVVVCARQVALARLAPTTQRQLGIDLVLDRPVRLDAIGEALDGLLRAGQDVTVLRLQPCADAGRQPGLTTDEGMVLAS